MTMTESGTQLGNNVISIRDDLERAFKLMADPDEATEDDLIWLAAGRGCHADDLDMDEAPREFLEDFLEIVGVWEGSSKDEAYYKGCRVVYCTGGPHIEVDTQEHDVKGWWGGDHARAGLDSDVCEYFDQMAEGY